MRDIYSAITLHNKAFLRRLPEGLVIENAEELAMGQLTEEEIEEYGTDIAPILSAWKETLQAV